MLSPFELNKLSPQPYFSSLGVLLDPRWYAGSGMQTYSYYLMYGLEFPRSNFMGIMGIVFDLGPEVPHINGGSIIFGLLNRVEEYAPGVELPITL